MWRRYVRFWCPLEVVRAKGLLLPVPPRVRFVEMALPHPGLLVPWAAVDSKIARRAVRRVKPAIFAWGYGYRMCRAVAGKGSVEKVGD
jgi:hypothetical protein